MVNRSRWKAAHDKFPAHVEEAKNSDGNVHRGYSLLEFRVAAELLRVGPIHSADDYWAPSDWQLLLVVSEYISTLLEFLDWFWPDLGWEHHKQAIVLSKRLLQPRSPHTYPDLRIDPQLRTAWHGFTYCFWHGTRHLPVTPPLGEPPAAYNAAREWLTKVVGDRGFETEGHIVSSLQSWIQSARPRLQEAFPAVDWSGWPAVVWPDPECAVRVVEKRGAVKRRQQEEDYAVRWPLRVTQGRPKFNHLKLEARDGFVVGIPSIKNPPALGFLAVSDVMCAFKQAAQHWPSTQPGSPSYLAQQDVVQSFVQNVLRETRGPLAPGIAHEKYRYVGYVACSVLGWNTALTLLDHPVRESAAWGPQPLVLPGGAAAALIQPQQHPRQHPQQPFQLHPPPLNLGAMTGLSVPGAVDPGIRIDLGIAAQLALQPELLMSPETEAALAMRMPQAGLARAGAVPLPLPAPLAAGASTAVQEAAARAETTSFGSLPLPAPTANGGAVGPRLAGQLSAPLSATAAVTPLPQQQPSQSQLRPDVKATRPRPSPFLARTSAATSSTNAGLLAHTAFPAVAPPPLPPPQQQQRDSPAVDEMPQREQSPRQLQQQQDHPVQLVMMMADTEVPKEVRAAATAAQNNLEDLAPMSLGGLSSMQDLIDGLPSQADLTLSTLLGAVATIEDLGAGADAAASGAGAGPSGSASDLMNALPSLFLPSWLSLRSPPRPGLSQAQPPKPHDQASSALQPEPATGPATPQAPLGLQAGDGGLSFAAPLLQPPPLPPPRPAPDAPVHVHLPALATSPCQATITTGALPSLALPSSAMPSLTLPSAGLSRPQLSGTESRSFTRRSHGEVSTLSPMTSCGAHGEVVPCSPAPAGAAAATTAADDEDATVVPPALTAGPPPVATATRKSGGVVTRERDRDTPAVAGLLSPGSRRTRHDVAVAAAAAAADQGLPPAPESHAERSAKRPNAQAEPRGPETVAVATAERVESLGAFLTDQQAGLPVERPMGQQQPKTVGLHHNPLSAASACAAACRAALGRQLLGVLRTWADACQAGGHVGDASMTAARAADVYRRVEQLLAQGAPVDVTEDGAAGAATCATEDSLAAASRAPPAGFTPLHWACLRGDAALAELLLRHGADPDRRDATGTSARLVNPGFAVALAEAAARCAVQGRPQLDTRRASSLTAQPCAHPLSSAFASSAGTATAVVVAAAEAAAQQNQLRNQLAELLRSADQVAAQLASSDPEAAACEVLQAIRDTDFLFRCIVSGGASGL